MNRVDISELLRSLVEKSQPIGGSVVEFVAITLRAFPVTLASIVLLFFLQRNVESQCVLDVAPKSMISISYELLQT